MPASAGRAVVVFYEGDRGLFGQYSKCAKSYWPTSQISACFQFLNGHISWFFQRFFGFLKEIYGFVKEILPELDYYDFGTCLIRHILINSF